MKLKHFLQGRFMAHPLHPALVHIPVGLWIGAFVFDLASLVSDNPLVGNALVTSSYYCILLGVIMAVPAAATGLAEFVDIPRSTQARSIAFTHMTLNVLLLAGYIVQLTIRNLALPRVEMGVFAFNLVEFLFLGISGYLGGRMAYALRVGSRAAPGEGVRVRDKDIAA
jgi:uncharacterized membrane protein